MGSNGRTFGADSVHPQAEGGGSTTGRDGAGKCMVNTGGGRRIKANKEVLPTKPQVSILVQSLALSLYKNKQEI
jgi:hypothetical protein